MFSICIPNFNYAHYLSQTLESILSQGEAEFEIRIRDNQSTDDSVAVVRAMEDPRIEILVNPRNVGFAPNLDLVVGMASRDWVILLSSDDVMRPSALATYRAMIEGLQLESGAVLCSAAGMIDGEGRRIGSLPLPRDLFAGATAHTLQDGDESVRFLRIGGHELLKRCLQLMANPFNFLTTCYPRQLWLEVDGYGSSRHINPDKWFHWKILSENPDVYYVDDELFDYRWHSANQTTQQTKAKALKFLADEYASTFQFPADVLELVGLKRHDLERAFVDYDIGRHGLAELAKRRRLQAKRILDFGRATYPEHCAASPWVRALSAALAMGPAGVPVAQTAYSVRNYWTQRRSHP
jgi:glycosyltransferase involved in cell wall biosynthesis